MARVKRGVIARARHKKILKQAKGYYGARSRVYRVAFQAVIKAGQYAYRDRRQRTKSRSPRWLKKRKQLWHKPVKRGSLAPSLLFTVQ